MPNVLSPRDLVSKPDNMEETVVHTGCIVHNGKTVLIRFASVLPTINKFGIRPDQTIDNVKSYLTFRVKSCRFEYL